MGCGASTPAAGAEDAPAKAAPDEKTSALLQQLKELKSLETPQQAPRRTAPRAAPRKLELPKAPARPAHW